MSEAGYSGNVDRFEAPSEVIELPEDIDILEFEDFRDKRDLQL